MLQAGRRPQIFRTQGAPTVPVAPVRKYSDSDLSDPKKTKPGLLELYAKENCLLHPLQLKFRIAFPSFIHHEYFPTL